jgi:hypothetical protein
MSDIELLAPLTGHYEELNVFGTPTGVMIHGHAGERLPEQPRGFAWRLRREPLPQGVSTPAHGPVRTVTTCAPRPDLPCSDGETSGDPVYSCLAGN